MILWCVGLGAGAASRAQSAKRPGATEGVQRDAVVAGQTVNGQAAGVIFGSVTDRDGDLVPDAKVVLKSGAEAQERTAICDSGGRFHFSGVAAGAYEITATAKGLAGGKMSGVMEAGAVVDAPAIRLGGATASAEVTVTPETEHQIAQQEVRTEEKQRVLAIVPNYFVTYDRNPAPLSSKQKFSLGVHAALDPTHFVFAAAVAGYEQEENIFPGFGTGPAAYGKRTGALLATTTTSEMLRGSVFPSLFHEDPRYIYDGEGTTGSRVKYALESAVICRKDDGRNGIYWASILGGLTAGAISNLYYAPSDRHGAGLTFESGALSIAGVAFGHLMQEFLFRRFTTHSGERHRGLFHGEATANAGAQP
ncbi:MAG: carboxypeptidase-like regulatory domain-containing protein [Acidobacteriaceae bacterium]